MMGKLLPIQFAALLFLTFSCAEVINPELPPSEEMSTKASIPYTEPDGFGDAIPDFSRVGYRWGDYDLPLYDNVVELEPPHDGSDARALIQDAIDSFSGSGAILLKAGEWHVDGTIYINRSGIVLRGEGESTVIVAEGLEQHSLIVLGKTTSRVIDESSASEITDLYTPVGQMYVNVAEPFNFNVGDRVVIYRPATQDWIHAIRMDCIADPLDLMNDVPSVQWTPEKYSYYYERVVTGKVGNSIYLDNPVVMAMEKVNFRGKDFGGGQLMKCSWDRISESGIENMVLRSYYNGDPTDENHAWTAIVIMAAEHCWVRDIVSYHFGFGQVALRAGARNITTQDCKSLEPVSVLTGSRRYAFQISDGECCIFKDCLADDDRHGFVTGRSRGPNVFLRCTMTNAHADMGPHLGWATGNMWDSCITDYALYVQDGAESGTGHGWRGANQVLWNCEAKNLCCQSPWISAKNYAIGCIGNKVSASRGQYYDDFGPRPDGVWISHGAHVTPSSLYEAQLRNRHEEGIRVMEFSSEIFRPVSN